jgi:hypothetical protein
MSTFKSKVSKFFTSSYKTFKELNEAEIKIQCKSNYENVLKKFEDSFKKFKEKDLSAVDQIKNCIIDLNEIIKVYNSSDVKEKFVKLAESIDKIDIENLEEESELLEYEMENLKAKLQEAGLDQPSPMSKEKEQLDQQKDLAQQNNQPKTPITPQSTTQTNTNVAQQNATEPNSTETSNNSVNPEQVNTQSTSGNPDQTNSANTQPQQNLVGANPEVQHVIDTAKNLKEDSLTVEPLETNTSSESKSASSAFEEGFDAGRKAWKQGSTHKNESMAIVEKELGEHSYSYVKRWEEGFKRGYEMEEERRKDLGEVVVDESEGA